MLARACAILSERLFLPPRAASTNSDLLSAIDGWKDAPDRVHHAARDIERLASAALGSAATADRSRDSEPAFLRAILAGYPDRVGQRREPRGARIRLASGSGAAIGPESGVRDGEFLIALDVQASTRQDDPDGRIRLASLVDREWLQPTAIEVVHRLDPSGTVRAIEMVRYDALVLAERPVAVDAAIAADLLSAAYLEREPSPADTRLFRRIRFAGLSVDATALAKLAAYGSRTLAGVQLATVIPAEVRQAIARDAPDVIAVPSGRSVRAGV